MTESRWCPSCGDEYLPHIAECADCHVPLVEAEPSELQPVTQEIERSVDGSELVVSFDLSELDGRQRGELINHLEANPLPHGWIDENTIAAFAGYEDELAVLVESVRLGGRPGQGFEVTDLAGRPATLSRRAISRVVDLAAFAAALAGASIALERGSAFGIALCVATAGPVLGLGERGRSLGKSVVGCVVRRRNGEQLTLGESFVRSITIDVPLALTALGVWSLWAETGVGLLLPAVGVVATAAIIGSVVLDPHGRGLADQLVDSAVYQRGTVGHTDGYLTDADLID